eukprot:scaffold222953_cov36-Attheya_sp.AAC.1
MGPNSRDVRECPVGPTLSRVLTGHGRTTGKSAYMLSGTFLQVRRQHFSLWQVRAPWYRTY